MYHAIVRRRVRGLWSELDRGNYQPIIETAAPDVSFRFIGETPLQADLSTRAELETWFRDLFERFPSIRFTPEAILVNGWPWKTLVNVRLRIDVVLADGTEYTNTASQWVALRWGRMVEDLVIEDTLALQRACAIQDRYAELARA